MGRRWRSVSTALVAGGVLLTLGACSLLPFPFSRTICSMPADIMTYSLPAYAHGAVYLGGRFGHLYAMRADTGQLLWEYTTTPATPEALSQPVVAGNVVYARDESHVYALDAQTGALRWARDDITSGYGFIPDPVVLTADAVVVANFQGIVALDASTGKTRWALARTFATTPAPLFANGIVYAGGDGLYALRASDGHILWHAPTADGLQATGMALAGAETILIGNALPTAGQTTASQPVAYLWAAQTSNGALLWRTNLDTPSRLGSVITAAGTAYAVISFNDGNTQNGVLHAYDVATGQETWRYSSATLGLIGDHEVTPIIAGDVAFLGGRHALALDVTTHQPLWEVAPSRLPVAIGAANDAFVYAVDGAYGGYGCGKPPQLVEGTVFALDAATGRTVWRVALSHGQAH